MTCERNYNPAQNSPYLLDCQQLADPDTVIEEFLQDYNLAEHRQILWDILCAAMNSDLTGVNGSRDIASWVMYFRSLEEVIEAISIITKNRNPSMILRSIL